MKTGAKSTQLTVIEPEVRLSVEGVALEMAVDTLERLGGDIDALTEKFDADKHLVLFHLQKRLTEYANPRLRERWERAIELFHLSRMRSLQRDAIRRLEELDPGDDKASRIELTYAKLILGDLFTSANVVARQKASTKADASSTLADAIAVMEQDDDAESA